MALRPVKEIQLWEGDDPSLSWEDRIQKWSDDTGMDPDLARHLAAIERGEEETIEPK